MGFGVGWGGNQKVIAGFLGKTGPDPLKKCWFLDLSLCTGKYTNHAYMHMMQKFLSKPGDGYSTFFLIRRLGPNIYCSPPPPKKKKKKKKYQAYPQGGYSNFYAYVGSGPASIVHPPKTTGISSTSKNIWSFSNPKKYPNYVPWP